MNIAAKKKVMAIFHFYQFQEKLQNQIRNTPKIKC